MHFMNMSSRVQRQMAGNICLVLFVAFLVLTASPIGMSAANAETPSSLQTLQKQVSVENNQVKVYMLLKPTTDTHYQSIFVDLTGVLGTPQVVEAVYGQVYDSIYGDVYGYAVNFVYDLPEGVTVDFANTPIFVKDNSGNLIQTEYVDLVVKPPEGEAQATFTISSNQNIFPVGKSVEMDIHLESVNELNGGQFVLRYNPAILRLTEFIPAPGLPETTIATIDHQAGTITFATASDYSLGKALDLGKVRFEVLSAGSTSLALDELEAIDIYGNELNCSAQPLNITTVILGLIQGTVELADRFDTNYAGVTVKDLSSGVQDITEVNGSYAIEGIAGNHELLASYPKYLRDKQVVALAEGETKTVNFELVSGDANGDNKVSLLDLVALAKEYPKTTPGVYQSDFNGDGLVSLIDLSILAKNYRAIGD